MLTLEEAKKTCCCRICGKPIQMPEGGGFPVGWKESFGKMVWPLKITLNFGKEFAHTDCLSS
jgi:hypothetical protein